MFNYSTAIAHVSVIPISCLILSHTTLQTGTHWHCHTHFEHFENGQNNPEAKPPPSKHPQPPQNPPPSAPRTQPDPTGNTEPRKQTRRERNGPGKPLRLLRRAVGAAARPGVRGEETGTGRAPLTANPRSGCIPPRTPSAHCAGARGQAVSPEPSLTSSGAAGHIAAPPAC